MILSFYIIGFLAVWIIDKRMTCENGWNALATRLAVALFSWGTLALFFVLKASEQAAISLEKYNVKQPFKWL
jgi:hypothetical protein